MIGVFLPLLMVAFLWAGMHVPLQSAWTGGRWFVLGVGAVIGYIVWMREPRRSFQTIHLLAFFCIGAAFVSATVSSYIQMASYKAVSLCLLFLYCTAGARLAVIGREERFFRGLIWGQRGGGLWHGDLLFRSRRTNLGQSKFSGRRHEHRGLPHSVMGMVQQRWPHREISQIGSLAALLIPDYLQPGASGNSFRGYRHACLLSLPAPIQAAHQDCGACTA